VVKGTEHIAWDQEATGSWTGQYKFFAYVDNQPFSLGDAACTPAGPQYTCKASLPPLKTGLNQVQIVTRDLFGRESARSASIYLEKR